MKLLTVLKEMNHMNTILWKGLNIRLLVKYLEDNNIGKIYEPTGKYFEEVVQNILDKLEVLTPQGINLIVNVKDILKYPLKFYDQDSEHPQMFHKVIGLNSISPDANLIWINEITTKPVTFEDVPKYINLGYTEIVPGGKTMIHNSRYIIRMDEKNSDKEVDVTVVKHINPDNINTKWVLNKDFEEVGKE